MARKVQIMRVILNGQVLPVNIRVNRDILITLRSLARTLHWKLDYDTTKELVYISTQNIAQLTERLPAILEEPESTRLTGKVICLDPGHGGQDTGAIGFANSLEKENNLAIALLVKDRLERNGASILMTHDEDTDITSTSNSQETAAARVSLANESHADIFVSIHNDSFADSQVSGTTTYHYGNAESARLAACIQNSLVEGLGTKDRGVRFGSFYAIRYTAMPSVHIEVAFISNPEEELLLSSADGRNKAAEYIANGIMRYFKV